MSEPVPVTSRTTPPRRLIIVSCALVLVVVLSVAFFVQGQDQDDVEHSQIPGIVEWAQPAPVPAGFFGATLNSSSGAVPTVGLSAVRLWDSRTRWSQIEPRRGHFDWHTLNRLVTAAQQARLPVLYTIGGTPDWASPAGPPAPYSDDSRTSAPDQPADWDAMVRATATRFRGRIEAYELWSTAPSQYFYSGSAQALARMTISAGRIIHRADPKALVVCPGISDLSEPANEQFLRDFAAAGGYRTCDVAAVKTRPLNPGETPAKGWQCRFLLPSAKGPVPAAIRWMEAGTAPVTLESGAQRVRYLNGNSAAVQPGSALNLTEEPVMIEYRS